MMRVWVGLLVGCAMGCETSPMDSGDGDSPGGAQSDSDSVSTEDSTDGSDTGSDRDADSDRDSGPDTDITTDSDTESDSDSDTGETWPTLMCDDTLGIRPPFRLTGDDWNDLDGRVNYEYELVFPVGEPNNAVVPSCDPNPPNYPHDREPGGYQFVYGSEIRMEVWLQAGEQVRVTEDGALSEAVYVMPSCTAGTSCIGSSGFGVPLTATAPSSGNYVVVVENREESPGIEQPYDILVEVLPWESCGDGVDNDDDGLVDCGDPECSSAPECEDVCVSIPFTPPRMTGVEPADSWAMTELESTHASCNPQALPPALVFEMQLEAGQQVVATTEDVNFGQNVSFTRSCDIDRVCVEQHGFGPYQRVFDVPESGTWYAIIQSQLHIAPSDVSWTVGIVEPEQCDTSRDDDLDGDAGCTDADCLFDPVCGFECPSVVVPPIAVSGGSWAVQHDNRWGYARRNGCFGEGGEDYLAAVYANAGDTITVGAPNGGGLPIVNITHENAGGCTPRGNENTCVYGYSRGAHYAVDDAGVHFVAISTPEEGYTGPYDWVIDVVTQ